MCRNLRLMTTWPELLVAKLSSQIRQFAPKLHQTLILIAYERRHPHRLWRSLIIIKQMPACRWCNPTILPTWCRSLLLQMFKTWVQRKRPSPNTNATGTPERSYLRDPCYFQSVARQLKVFKWVSSWGHCGMPQQSQEWWVFPCGLDETFHRHAANGGQTVVTYMVPE